SFVAVIISLLFMRFDKPIAHNSSKKVMSELKEGFAYLKVTPEISSVIVFLAIMSLLVLPYGTLLPFYANIIFKGHASTFGYLNGCIGLGAICGTLMLASLKPSID